MPRRPVPAPDDPPNARTVASYELIAADYARETAGGGLSAPLARLVAEVPAGEVLEIGSGPGWDADALEDAGLRVRRTDVTQAFLDLQRDRGRHVERLDAITDEYGGPYDAVVALYVLQHVAPDDLPTVLGKVAGALRPDGRFLTSFRLGEGVGWEVGESGNPYFRSLWSEQAVVEALRRVGLEPSWTEQSVDEEDSHWLLVLARRSGDP